MTADAKLPSLAFRVRLLCVLMADAVGYSRLMSLDDGGTLAALDAGRAVFREHVVAHGGRIIDMAGDSILAVFETATGAVGAALAIQARIAAAAADTPENRRLRFRIGVHLGDVIEKPDGTVYGDGVNIAARLEELAIPGGIAVSNAVHDVVCQRVEAFFKDIGPQQIRNLAHPVHAYQMFAGKSFAGQSAADLGRSQKRILSPPKMKLVIAIGISVAISITVAIASRLSRSQSTAPLLSLAVLHTKSEVNPAPDHVTDAFARDLTAALSHSMLGSSIIANSAVAPLQGISSDARVLGKKLNVRYVLESVLSIEQGDFLVGLVLVNAENAKQIWSDRLVIPAERAAAWPELPVLRSAKAVHVALWTAEQQRLSAHRLDGDDPMEIVFLALMTDTSTGEGLESAKGLCEKALRLKPQLPAAVICKARTILAEIANSPDTSQPALHEEADRLSLTAISLDRDDAMAWRLRSDVLRIQQLWEPALEANSRAIALDPEFAVDLRTRARYMILTGSPDLALPLIRRAMEIAPKDIGAWERTACHAYLALGRYSDATDSCEKSLSDGEPWEVSAHLAVAYAQQGELAKAGAARRRAMLRKPDLTIPWYRGWVTGQSDNKLYTEQYREHIEPGLERAGFAIR